MATVTREGHVHINTVYFCYSAEFELFFLSHPGATHCRNISHNPSMAMVIFSSVQQWGGPDKGIQLFGTCSQVMGSHVAKAEELYGKRVFNVRELEGNAQTRGPCSGVSHL